MSVVTLHKVTQMPKHYTLKNIQAIKNSKTLYEATQIPRHEMALNAEEGGAESTYYDVKASKGKIIRVAPGNAVFSDSKDTVTVLCVW